MQRRVKLFLAAGIIGIIALSSVLVGAAVTQTFLFSRSLQISSFAASGDVYMANVTDAGAAIAHIYVRIENPPPGSSHVPIQVSMWHTNTTEVDSLRLTFRTQPHVTSLFLEASSFEWPQSEFHQDGIGALLAVRDLGWYGGGTVTLDFILVQNPASDDLALTVDFTMHETSLLQLTALTGLATLNVPLPLG